MSYSETDDEVEVVEEPTVEEAETVEAPVEEDPTSYTVQEGDILSSIATKLGLLGGWGALYLANIAAIGPDPSNITPGQILVLP